MFVITDNYKTKIKKLLVKNEPDNFEKYCVMQLFFITSTCFLSIKLVFFIVNT